MGIMTSEARTAFGLTALLAPVLPDDHWERKPLHLSRGDAHYYDSLLSNQDLEVIISSTDLRYPAIQLARNGAYLASEAYTKNIKHGSEFFNFRRQSGSRGTASMPAFRIARLGQRSVCSKPERPQSEPNRQSTALDAAVHASGNAGIALFI
jgi:hypothetical protein